MTNCKLLRQDVKQNYTQDNVAEMLIFIGHEVSRSYKLRLRAEEKTPSASISRTGQITDFGNGWSGDIVAVLHEFKNIPLGEATMYVAKLLNIDIEKYKI